jgi:hypothetical protein
MVATLGPVTCANEVAVEGPVLWAVVAVVDVVVLLCAGFPEPDGLDPHAPSKMATARHPLTLRTRRGRTRSTTSDAGLLTASPAIGVQRTGRGGPRTRAVPVSS